MRGRPRGQIPSAEQGLDIGATVRVTLTGVPPDVVITAIERENP